MRLINRCGWGRTGYDFNHNHSSFQDQVRQWIVVLACLLIHLALFQLVDASTSSSSSSGSASLSFLELPLPLGNGNDNASPKARSRGQAVISSVPEGDRGIFVFYHLARALNVELSNENYLTPRTVMKSAKTQKDPLVFKDIRTYETFSADLLKWTMEMFRLSRLDVYNLLKRNANARKVLCTSRGLCFNPNDIGVMCCPF